ncbi:TPA: hypothetical protein ACVO3J_001819 [Vibrio alginolyticus]|uniref:hypothetical protein n=1 Tax=Vibrio alginolyticus TaxID=663 RepID=UPI00215B907D|nr:hypothetical protein [Vibrio alginolyticus]MCR9516300.1 hypothetical protein [Vibrio alginolyticus]
MLFRVCILVIFYTFSYESAKAEDTYPYIHQCDSIVCKLPPEPSYYFDEPAPLVLSIEPTKLPEKLALTIYFTSLLMLDESSVEVRELESDIQVEHN